MNQRERQRDLLPKHASRSPNLPKAFVFLLMASMGIVLCNYPWAFECCSVKNSEEGGDRR